MQRVFLNKKRIRIYLLLLLVVIVWVYFYNGPMPYITLFGLLLYFPVSFFWIWLESAFWLRLDLSAGSSRLTKGEATPVKIVIENDGWGRINDLRLIPETMISRMEGIDTSENISLIPGQRMILEGTLRMFFAGVYEVGLTGLTYGDPFGMISCNMKLPQPFRMQSIPRITDMADEFLSQEDPGSLGGQYLSSLWEPILGNDLRAYQNGESVRRINWKVSAVRQELYIRKPEHKELHQVAIFLKIRTDDSLNQKHMDAIMCRDWILEFAVSAAAWFFHNGWAVTAYVPVGSVMEFRITNHDSFRMFCEELSGAVFYNGKTVQEEFAEKMAAASENPEMLAMIIDEVDQKVLWDNQQN